MNSSLRFTDNALREAFYSLESGDDSQRELFKHLNVAFDAIETNAFCGIQIPKRLIPYDVHNLWKYNLPKGWRLLYSVEADGVLVVSIIVEWLSHKKYERRFGY